MYYKYIVDTHLLYHVIHCCSYIVELGSNRVCHPWLTWKWPEIMTLWKHCGLKKKKEKAICCSPIWCVVWFRPGEDTRDGKTGGREDETRVAEEKKGLGEKYGSYQHSPRQKNRTMMKAKSREEKRDWQAQTEREWRLKWQKDK